jgi:hypothetical protein
MRISSIRRAAVLAISFVAVMAIAASHAWAYGQLGESGTRTPTGNLVTGPFYLTAPGLDMKYLCNGGAPGTRLQVVDYYQRRAFRDFPARCDGNTHTVANVYGDVPVHWTLRVRLHNYAGRTFTGSVYVWGDGRRYPR